MTNGIPAAYCPAVALTFHLAINAQEPAKSPELDNGDDLYGNLVDDLDVSIVRAGTNITHSEVGGTHMQICSIHHRCQ